MIDSEDFAKYFLYSLVGIVLADIRFDSKQEGALDKQKTWKITNFIIDLPIDLYKGGNTTELEYHSKLLSHYEEESKNLNIHRWFREMLEIRYSFYRKKFMND